MKWLAAPAVAMLVALAVPVSANHPQNAGNLTVTFDHDGDNEWWVEVLTRTESGDSIVLLEVRPESGAYRGLQEKGMVNGWMKWGPEEAFRIPPGDRVMFRAHIIDGATGGTGIVASCWFTHPAGVEQCSASPPPPGRWDVQGLAVFDGFPNDLSVGDPDHDGRREVYLAAEMALYRLAPVRTAVSNDGPWLHVAIGDADRDGSSELYALGLSDAGTWELHRFTFDTAWRDEIIATGDAVVGPLTFGDVDRDGKTELYVTGQVPGDGTKIGISQVFKSGGVWHVNRVATIQDDTTFGTTATNVWVGDADADGQTELVVSTAGKPGYFIHVVDFTTAWTTQEVANVVGPSFIVAGDLGDGIRSIAALNSVGELHRYTKSTAGWTDTHLTTVPGGWGQSLFLGDGDGDGRVELYAASNNAHAYQVRVAGATAAVTDMGLTSASEDLIGRIVVGDGDNDGKPEVYMAAFDGESDLGHIYQYDFLPAMFDATFTGVRGNEWWIQANVAASGAPLAKVDVRLNNGDWKPLTKHSWGGWAASYHAVQGAMVQFRATSSTGATDLSDCYGWIPPSNTDATKVACSQPPPAFDATFSGVKGNEWWVQVQVAANQPLAGVDARVQCGAWVALSLQSWGGWAKNFHVDPGAKVDFRARSTGGATDGSGAYIWPNATPTTGCP
jgi:hypothetical protein